MLRPNRDDYRSLFVNDIPMMDTRAPIEFEQGAFPLSENLPLMTNDERAAVGTCYKQQGQQAAIDLGHQLVNDQVKAARVASWKAFCEANPNGYLYCFRGGLRSKITQQWLKEAGIDYPFIIGGDKALRRYLINTIDEVASMPMTIVGGYTGSGKTLLVNQIENGIDLEGAANHRGSSFGRYVTQQRSNINFENELAVQMIKKLDRGIGHFVFEDEGKFIGCAALPLSLHKSMKQAKLVIIEDPFDIRLSRLIEEYVVRMQQDYVDHYGEELGWKRFSEYLEKGIFNIRRRLGLERYQALLKSQQLAVKTMQVNGSLIDHEAWLVPLLKEYYDPMYGYQLSKSTERTVFKGNYQQVKLWLEQV